jgi:hypothetical protein
VIFCDFLWFFVVLGVEFVSVFVSFVGYGRFFVSGFQKNFEFFFEFLEFLSIFQKKNQEKPKKNQEKPKKKPRKAPKNPQIIRAPSLAI